MKLIKSYIPFNKPANIKTMKTYVNKVLDSGQLAGSYDGFNKKCVEILENHFRLNKILLTTSCTHALEISAILLEIEDGDEVIMPSYTFSSSANAFILRGAKIVFVDIRPDTMNIDEKLIDYAITKKTKAIVPVHIAGVGCEMDSITSIGKHYNLFIVEDAAQGIFAYYKNKALGSIGHLGAFSFHETKNVTSGEGGAILVNDKEFIERAEIIIEKGTNRKKYFRGEIDKYNWQDIGSSYILGEINAACLYAQLEIVSDINKSRMRSWNLYYNNLSYISHKGFIELPFIPDGCIHNAHMFYIKVKNLSERNKIIKHLNENNIKAHFHYIPLHSSRAGIKYGRFVGKDKYTTNESERLLRLPLYYGISNSDIEKVCQTIKDFYSN